jgi:hypothetical protein
LTRVRRTAKLTCGPLSFGDVGSPFFPILLSFTILLQPLLLLGQVLVTVNYHHLVEPTAGFGNGQMRAVELKGEDKLGSAGLRG